MSIHTQINRAMSHAQLAIAPGTGHGLPADKPELCNLMITEFLTEVSR
jgi:pimeloyl-ACP methyl ester carboxylesterase